jgi:hypothetical protein
MTDYIVTYKLNNETKDKIITIEDEIYIKPNKKDKYEYRDIVFEENQIIEELLLNELMECFKSETVELVDFIPVNTQSNLYRITEDDVYFDKETYI